ncbi:hypothetical protein [Sporomusa termitida]|uniref:hypothetical protein n=1 Tax=Sporomusa termitida TaxID=2377 RepID=UPI001184C60B|nr:hypothetical protein [Sporomusa termitida]
MVYKPHVSIGQSFAGNLPENNVPVPVFLPASWLQAGEGEYGLALAQVLLTKNLPKNQSSFYNGFNTKLLKYYETGSCSV